MWQFLLWREDAGNTSNGGLTHESVQHLHPRNGLEDRYFEKISASRSLVQCSLYTSL